MALQFQKAPIVTAGDPPRSRDFNKLAEAWNSRIRSGVGDIAWRITYYAWTLFKAMVNPDASGDNFHAFDEWFLSYAHLKPQSGVDWPSTGDPGEPEGLNLANPVAQFYAGNPVMESEDERTFAIDLALGPNPTLEEYWRMGQRQRGVTGASPAFEVAREHFKIVPNPINKMLLSYGGFQPTPEQIGDCGNVDPDFGPAPLYKIFFTPIRDGLSIKEYSGFCPDGSPGSQLDGALRGLTLGATSYHVYLWDGTEEILSFEDYIIGPYTGTGTLTHGNSDAIDQVLNKFILEFRGNDAQRATTGYDAFDQAFKFQDYLTRQNLLAPNYPMGPLFEFNTSVAAGTFAEFLPGQITYGIHSDYTFAGVFIKATGLKAATSLTIYGRGAPIVVQLKPGANKAAQALQFFAPSAELGTVSVKCNAAIDLEAGGSVTMEIAELEVMKPNIIDAYLLIRLASTEPASTDGNDVIGTDFGQSPRITSDYFQYGAIVNRQDSLGLKPWTSIARNGIYESARRLVHDNVRCARKEDLVGYEVTGGKSILFFKRFALGDSDMDAFDGIGPAFDPVTRVKDGIVYLVRTGSVIYRQVTYFEGQQFTGEDGFPTFEGTGSVFEYDGIRAIAGKKQFSNEWVAFSSWIGYNDAEGSTWKPDAYGNIVGFLHNPCHFYSSDLTRGDRSSMLFQISAAKIPALLKPVIVAECPSGYNYANGTNAGAVEDDYKSCQIYKPPWQIESVVAWDDGSGTWDQVKVTLSTRVQHNEDAPEEISRNVFDTDLLRSQIYNTDESRILKWLAHQNGLGDFNVIHGDTAQGVRTSFRNDLAFVQSLSGNDTYNSAILPRFYFVRLIPNAYEDENDTQEATDSPLRVDELAQMEFYARAGCEGFLDLQAHIGSADCGNLKMWDYTFENCHKQANDNRWFNTIPFDINGERNIKGHGPLPRTELYADIFNQHARFVNLLTRARIELPLTLQVNHITDTGIAAITPDYSSGDPLAAGPCTAGNRTINGDGISSPGWALWNGAAPVSGDSHSETGWQDFNAGDPSNTISSQVFSAISNIALCDGSDWRWTAVGQKSVDQWRIKTDQPAMIAVPDDLKALITNRVGLFLATSYFQTAGSWELAGSPVDNPSCNGEPWPGLDVKFTETGGALIPGCVYASGGTVELPDPPVTGTGIHVTVSNPSGSSLINCVHVGYASSISYSPAGGVVGDGNLFVDIPVVE